MAREDPDEILPAYSVYSAVPFSVLLFSALFASLRLIELSPCSSNSGFPPSLSIASLILQLATCNLKYPPGFFRHDRQPYHTRHHPGHEGPQTKNCRPHRLCLPHNPLARDSATRWARRLAVQSESR